MSNFKWSLNSSLWHQKCKRKGFTSIRKVFSLGKETENEKKSISTQKKSNSTSEEKYFYIEKKSIYIKKTGRKEKEKKSISTHPSIWLFQKFPDCYVK